MKNFLRQLPDVRSKIDEGRYAAKPVIHYYTTVIFRLNTVNPVPVGVRIYLPEANDDMAGQKLISEIAIHPGIICNNIYNVLYSKGYGAETLPGVMEAYQVFGSYEKDLQKEFQPAIKAYNTICNKGPLKSTVHYLDKALR